MGTGLGLVLIVDKYDEENLPNNNKFQILYK